MTKKPFKLTKKDRAILNSLPEGARDALSFYYVRCAEDSLASGHKPMPLAEMLSAILFDWLKTARAEDRAAQTAFLILCGPRLNQEVRNA